MNGLMPVRHLPQSHTAWEVPPTPPSWLIAVAAGMGDPAVNGAAGAARAAATGAAVGQGAGAAAAALGYPAAKGAAVVVGAAAGKNAEVRA